LKPVARKLRSVPYGRGTEKRLGKVGRHKNKIRTLKTPIERGTMSTATGLETKLGEGHASTHQKLGTGGVVALPAVITTSQKKKRGEIEIMNEQSKNRWERW